MNNDQSPDTQPPVGVPSNKPELDATSIVSVTPPTATPEPPRSVSKKTKIIIATAVVILLAVAAVLTLGRITNNEPITPANSNNATTEISKETHIETILAQVKQKLKNKVTTFQEPDSEVYGRFASVGESYTIGIKDSDLGGFNLSATKAGGSDVDAFNLSLAVFEQAGFTHAAVSEKNRTTLVRAEEVCELNIIGDNNITNEATLVSVACASTQYIDEQAAIIKPFADALRASQVTTFTSLSQPKVTPGATTGYRIASIGIVFEGPDGSAYFYEKNNTWKYVAMGIGMGECKDWEKNADERAAYRGITDCSDPTAPDGVRKVR